MQAESIVKTWKQLDDLAKQDGLELDRPSELGGQPGGVSICHPITHEVFVSIVGGDLDDRASDTVVRAACESALRALKVIER